ncbi:MAG: bifunctional 23S rRNA (guanine(2069)-N(7))-methyltransferase RlmK/23S rRNA (guanine(2445)-N(2))-methyltransferase RlmL [Deltaproteobacteria bacterium]|nr:bifunctional 23S rRNA (guanine(2069)-N(7))-methyltransferase RlmK/23S rRNA (guanine(2445)-N(2))-methyltransferase RlmL [Deltaproteobacteria bacterium]
MAEKPLHHFHAPAALGLSQLVARELEILGARDIRVGRAATSFRGPLEVGYRACLWSRCASRVLLELARFPAPDAKALYRGARELDWLDQMEVAQTFAVRATGSNRELRHTGFVAQQVKDAIVDSFRDRLGCRPSVDTREPDLQFQVHIEGAQATISLDLSGAPLHRRGYRVPGSAAPLKETVAAGMLLLAGWPEIAAQGRPFADPMCGGGTLPIEAALMAGDQAPGLARPRFGLQNWLGHDEHLWERLKAEAEDRALTGRTRIPSILGFDPNSQSLQAARQAAHKAGLEDIVLFEMRELQGAYPPSPGPGEPSESSSHGKAQRTGPAGLVAVNPPYGHRLGEVAQLRILYSSLGRILRDRFAGYRVAVLTAEQELSASMGLGRAAETPMRNGAIDCVLSRYDAVGMAANPTREQGRASSQRRAPRDAHTRAVSQNKDGLGLKGALMQAHGLSPAADGFANRLRKKSRHLGKWAKRNGITCYRVYDADLPEYAVAIDRYEDLVHVQEYAPPATIEPATSAERLADVMALVPEILGLPKNKVFLKVRQRQKGRGQYRKIGEGGSFHEVHEEGHRFLINLEDYLDTGLFLDHRLVRARLAELGKGTRFLNLFCYTATATVYAARAGATQSTSVDRSATYLGWARRNFALNGISDRKHVLIRADSRRFLDETHETWDLIFVDPPTFSNTKSGDPPFDIQKDHVKLLTAAARHLTRNGVLVFSTNMRRFKLTPEALSHLEIQDISASCLPEDFKRSPRIHQVYELRNRSFRK